MMKKKYSFDSKKIIKLFCDNGAVMLGVFGSEARGEATAKSDIDLIVKFSKSKSLLQLVRLEREASETLGRKVDLLTEQAISPHLRDIINSELQVIYEA